MARNIDSISKQGKKKEENPAPKQVKEETPAPSTPEAPTETAAETTKPETTQETAAPTQASETAAPESEQAAQQPGADTFEALFPEPSIVLSGPPAWIWWILLVLAAAALGFLAYDLTKGRIDSWLSISSATPIPEASASATETATTNSPSPSSESSPTTTPTPETTSTPTTPPPTSAVVPSSVTLRILNGTTTNGLAASTKTLLEAAGYAVRTTGNARNQTYTKTYIYYQVGKLAEAEAIETILKTKYTTVLEESTLANPDNVLVVVGQ